MNTKTVHRIIVALICLVLVGCSAQTTDEEIVPAAPASDAPKKEIAPTALASTSPKAEVTLGRLEIFLTDAPPVPNITQVLVTVSSIQVHRAAAGEAPDQETEAGWFTVVETAQTFDLIAVKDVKALLGSAELEPGKYTQIRLNVDKAVATIDGVEHELEIPSGKIKLIQPFTIEAGQTMQLTLDFDAQASIHAAGKKYIMRPTIKVLVEGTAGQ